jgi:hypothetical protein
VPDVSLAGVIPLREIFVKFEDGFEEERSDFNLDIYLRSVNGLV